MEMMDKYTYANMTNYAKEALLNEGSVLCLNYRPLYEEPSVIVDIEMTKKILEF